MPVGHDYWYYCYYCYYCLVNDAVLSESTKGTLAPVQPVNSLDAIGVRSDGRFWAIL